jgi:hypothetical protein
VLFNVRSLIMGDPASKLRATKSKELIK